MPLYRYYLVCLFLAFFFLLNSRFVVSARSQIIKKALVFYDQENYVEAQALVEQANQDIKSSKQASTWYYRGVIYEQLMRKNIALDTASQYLSQALESYQKTLSLAPEANQYHSFAQINLDGLWVYYLNRGIRYYKSEAFEQAIETFHSCKLIQAKRPYSYLYIAIAAHQVGEYKLALEQYHAYLKLEKGKPVVYRGLANLTICYLQEPESAKQILDQAIQQYPWEVGLLEEQYNLLGTLNQLEGKEQQLKEQIAKNPRDPVCYFQLGYLYEQTDKLLEAGGCYQTCASLVPKKLEPICRLAIVYYNQGAKVLNYAATIHEEVFQKEGEQLTLQAEEYLKSALYTFKQARKLKRSDLFIAKQLYIIYGRLNMPEKVKIMEKALKRIKGGAAILASIS